jgi:tetratricopeptide (TPR) repeat protein
MNEGHLDLDLDKKKAIALKEEGVTLLGRGNFDEAMACFQKAINLNSRDLEALFHLGHCFMSKGDYDRSLRCFQQTLQLDPNSVNALYGIAYALEKKRLYPEAIQVAEQALGIFSESFELQNFLGGLYHQTRQLEKAIEHYRISLSLNATCSPVYTNLGKAYEDKGLRTEAVKVYREALQLSSSHSPLYPLFDRLESEYPILANQFENIEGFLFPLEGYTLRLLAIHGMEEGQIVEIGSYKGRSTCWLASASKEAGREQVTAVDHFKSPILRPDLPADQEWTSLDHFMENIRNMGLEEYVSVVASDSETAIQSWNRPIRLLFIDGDHSYEASKVDFECWSPYVIQKGYVVFHDIEVWDGVTRFYNDLNNTSQEFTEILSVMSLRVMQRISRGVPTKKEG